MDFEVIEGARTLDLSARGKIRVHGEDRARLLHAMTTNHVEQLEPGQGCYAFFLNAQGRILADVNILCFEDHFLLDTEPETRDKIREHLGRYIIADDVTLEDVTAELGTLAVEGPGAADVLRSLGAPLPESWFHWQAWGDRIIARLSYAGGPGWFVFGPPPVEIAGAEPGTGPEFRIARIESGKPRYGEDITERYLLQETGLLHAVHFSKGCYLGQEIVERVRSRAQIHRVLMPLRIDTAEPPPAGAKLTSDGQPAGEITSAVFSPTFGKVAALGYVRVPHNLPGAVLACGDARAEVAEPWRPSN